MQAQEEWTRKAVNVLASGQRPHFAPDREALEMYRTHIETAQSRFDRPVVLVLGATPELADLALAYGCRLYRVDCNLKMFEAAGVRQQLAERSGETIICGDWLNMEAIADGAIDLVMGDAAVNQISHADMPGLFAELRRITHPGSILSLKQIVMPDGRIDGFDFDSTVRRYRAGELTPTEFFKILRFHCFLDEAYDPASRRLDAEKVFSAIRRRYDAGLLSPEEFGFLYARRGKLRHTVYTRTRQREHFQENLGECKPVCPGRGFVYENIYNMFFITVAAGT